MNNIKTLSPLRLPLSTNQVQLGSLSFWGYFNFMELKNITQEMFIGKTFNYWTILGEVEKINYERMVRVKCRCGKIKNCKLLNIFNGQSKSCGCMPHNITSHGMTRTRIYGIYNDIKTRCYNPKRGVFKHYGGRGITMCEEWLNSFQCFYDWALNNGYEETLTIDRKENDGNYCPENCRWITMQEQCRNRRSNKKITFNGETKIAVEWAEQYGISQDLFENRRRRGWDIERALTTPADRLDPNYRQINSRKK